VSKTSANLSRQYWRTTSDIPPRPLVAALQDAGEVMNDSQLEISDKPSRKLRLLLFLLSPKVAIPLMILLALLAAPFMYRMHQINKLPDIGDPFDVEAFGTVEIPDEENAFVEYRAASKLLVGISWTSARIDELVKALEEGLPAASPDIRKWVLGNRPAMELWRKGTEKPDALYHQPKDVNVFTELNFSQNLRELAQLAVIEGLWLEEAGELQEAWKWYRAMYRNSRHSGRYGTLIQRLLGASIQLMASNSIERWSRNPRVTSEHLKQAIQQLKSDYRMTAPSSDAYKVEYLTLQNSIADYYGVEGMVLPFDKIELSESMQTVGFFLDGEPELSRRVMQHIWQNQLAHIDKPLHERPNRTSHIYDMLFESSSVPAGGSSFSTLEEIESAIESSDLIRLLLPVFTLFDEAIRREQLRHRALIVVLATQWYKREHGEFPEKIDDLLDGYLDEIPLDPHDVKGGKLQYRRNVDGFTVWGLGQNGRDDGGRIGWDSDDDFGFHVGEKEEPGG
jgi:hypothetical protein